MPDRKPPLLPRQNTLRVPLALLIAALACGLALAQDEPAPPLPPEPPTPTVPPGGEPATAGAADEDSPETPTDIKLSPLVRRLIDDAITADDERRKLRVFHGQWSELDAADPLPPADAAQLALLRYELEGEALTGDAAPPLLGAEAALLRGEPEKTLELLAEDKSAHATLLRARAHEMLGQLPQAIALLRPWRDRLSGDPINDAAELTAAAQMVTMLARLEGRPANDYQLALNLLARVRDTLDPLYWPARLAEAELLVDKDNRGEAANALLEALTLNPSAGDAWYRLGVLNVEGFDFDRAKLVADKLRAINPTHPLADLLEARSLLQQRDAAGARKLTEAGLARYPQHREWLAMLASVEALAYDEAETKAVLDRIDQLSPGSPDAYFTVGQVLSAARQYDDGAATLREAIKRQPNWPGPWIELGLLLMQDGDLPAAREALATATRLDPFNKRAVNQLRLADELLGYATLETEHFIIRFKKGIDEALALDMPDELERMHREITAAFRHVPPVKTQIDIMPDERYFGVRITGMPEIWTIAAATGDVLSLTPPREGPNQRGPFNWANVVRHEFVHTVTLSQTKNRIPHWFTEACAVSQETTGRDFQTSQLLAWALHHDKLFNLDTVNWGFVRPQTERDRPLAYAQSDWMLEFIAARFGHDAIVSLLGLYREGVSDEEAMQRVTGRTPDAFMTEFKAWAAEQVESWGMGKRETSERAQQVLASGGEGVTDEDLRALLAEDPEHPDLLRLAAQRAAQSGDAAAAERAILRYAAARPVDDWPHRELVKLAARVGDLEMAVPSLEQLDRQDTYTSAWSRQLAEIHRAAGRLDDAADAAGRALLREPYNAALRTLAATIDVQRGNLERAWHHLRALTILEPARSEHHVRLAAILTRLGRADDARAAALKARELDPKAPVDAFLK